MALFTAGNVLTAAQLNALNGYKEKTADQSVTSSTTLVNDTHMAYTLPFVGTYLVDVYMFGVSAIDNAGHIRYGFSFPTGSTMHYGMNVPSTGLTTGSTIAGTYGANLSVTSGVAAGVGGLSASGTFHWLHGKITVTTTGTLQFMWAQSTSNANASTLKSGSHMWVRQVA